MNAATTTAAKYSAPQSVPVGMWRPAVPVAVMVGYLLSVVAAGVASVHWAPIVVGGLSVPAGTLFAGAGLTARDLLHDALGARAVAFGIVAGAGLTAMTACPRIAVADAVAFTASEIVDALIYAQLRHHTRMGAVAASNAAGLVIDSVLFAPLAFGSSTAVPGQILGKTAVTTLTLALLQGIDSTRRVARS